MTEIKMHSGLLFSPLIQGKGNTNLFFSHKLITLQKNYVFSDSLYFKALFTQKSVLNKIGVVKQKKEIVTKAIFLGFLVTHPVVVVV